MQWHRHIDIYCERVDPSFWAEPLNAISNLAFILAAAWASYSAIKHGITLPALWFLIFLAFCIGIGSFLFHTFATVWAGLADTLPIWLFVLSYTLVCIWLIGQVSPRKILLGTALIACFGAAVLVLIGLPAAEANASPRPPSRFNGSEQYLPAVIAMVIFTTLTMIGKHPIRYWFLAATLTFFVSLTFRSFDMAICDTLPYGIHYFWHILNGLMIGLLLQALIHNIKRTPNP